MKCHTNLFSRVHMTSQRFSTFHAMFHIKPGARCFHILLTDPLSKKQVMAAKALVVAFGIFLGWGIITNGAPTESTHPFCRIVW